MSAEAAGTGFSSGHLELPSTPFRAAEVLSSDGRVYWSVTDNDEVAHRVVDDYLRLVSADGVWSRDGRPLYARSLACFLNWAHMGGHDLETAAYELPDFSRRLYEGVSLPRSGQDWRPGSPERAEQALAIVCDYYSYLVEQGLMPPGVLRHTRQVRAATDAGVKSFAQNGEDLQIAFHVGRRAARYIDVGCLWPTQHSNSYYFYRRGGFGLCIDPNPAVADDFRRVRPRDIFLDVGLAAAPGAMTYYLHENAVHNTSSSERARHHERVFTTTPANKGRRRTGTVEIPVITLEEAVRHSGLLDRCDGQVDFLSVDVAGSELDVLAGFSFTAVRPRLVVVEHVRRGEDRRRPVEELPVVTAMREHEYRLVGFSGVNLYLLDERS
jgi:FkbM family methyltransferase